jgi:hypothetical protein
LIGSSGGVEAIVASMRTNADIAEHQMMGCEALCILALNHAANRTLIGSLGGLQAIVTATQTHADVWWAGFRPFPKRTLTAVADYTKCAHADCDDDGYTSIFAHFSCHFLVFISVARVGSARWLSICSVIVAMLKFDCLMH